MVLLNKLQDKKVKNERKIELTTQKIVEKTSVQFTAEPRRPLPRATPTSALLLTGTSTACQILLLGENAE